MIMKRRKTVVTAKVPRALEVLVTEGSVSLDPCVAGLFPG